MIKLLRCYNQELFLGSISKVMRMTSMIIIFQSNPQISQLDQVASPLLPLVTPLQYPQIIKLLEI